WMRASEKNEVRRSNEKSGLTFTQSARLKILPAEISDLLKKIRALERKLSDPSLYTNDPIKFSQVTEAHETLTKALDSSELEWLELEELATK
ncbi:MAG: ABC transporter C-terminal domain-containing protein, partial [Alphaproteobacteria bacterium]